MAFPQLAQFTDVALLLLRLMVGIVFITSSWNHLWNLEEDATSDRVKLRHAAYRQ